MNANLDYVFAVADQWQMLCLAPFLLEQRQKGTLIPIFAFSLIQSFSQTETSVLMMSWLIAFTLLLAGILPLALAARTAFCFNNDIRPTIPIPWSLSVSHPMPTQPRLLGGSAVLGFWSRFWDEFLNGLDLEVLKFRWGSATEVLFHGTIGLYRWFQPRGFTSTAFLHSIYSMPYCQTGLLYEKFPPGPKALRSRMNLRCSNVADAQLLKLWYMKQLCLLICFTGEVLSRPRLPSESAQCSTVCLHYLSYLIPGRGQKSSRMLSQ